MSHTEDGPSVALTPPWAVEQATEELYDDKDPAVIAARAREIAREGRQLEHESHDEYDDPDEGGEG